MTKKSECSRFSNAFLTFFQEKVRMGYKTLRHIGENASCQLTKMEKRAKLEIFAFWETQTAVDRTEQSKEAGFHLTCDSQVGWEEEKATSLLDFISCLRRWAEGLAQLWLRRVVRRKYSLLQRASARWWIWNGPGDVALHRARARPRGFIWWRDTRTDTQ